MKRIRRGRSGAVGRRFASVFAGNVLAAFGGVSALVQFVGQLFPHALPHPGAITVASVFLCLSWGILSAYPLRRAPRVFGFPQMTIIIEAGNLFERTGHLVVGFTDTFDTGIGPGEPIRAGSVQGQLLEKVYEGDVECLDLDLLRALRGVRPVGREKGSRKPRGKLLRYPLGTVAVLDHDGSEERLVFALAYSRIDNGGVAQSSVEWLSIGLDRLWEAVFRRAHQEPVAMPLIGSGLARLSFLDQGSLLRMILLSFVLRCRERRVCRELRIVLAPADLARIDMTEIAVFLRALGATAVGP
jgi:hypothetical protein